MNNQKTTFLPRPPQRTREKKKKPRKRTGYDSSHNKNIFFVLYCPSGSLLGLFLKPQTSAAEFRCVPGKNVVLAKKDSKKFVFSTKSLAKISFFLFSLFFSFFVFAPKMLQHV